MKWDSKSTKIQVKLMILMPCVFQNAYLCSKCNLHKKTYPNWEYVCVIRTTGKIPKKIATFIERIGMPNIIGIAQISVISSTTKMLRGIIGLGVIWVSYNYN